MCQIGETTVRRRSRALLHPKTDDRVPLKSLVLDIPSWLGYAGDTQSGVPCKRRSVIKLLSPLRVG